MYTLSVSFYFVSRSIVFLISSTKFEIVDYIVSASTDPLHLYRYFTKKLNSINIFLLLLCHKN